MHNFHDAQGTLTWGRSKGSLDSPSWAVPILPYIEQPALWSLMTTGSSFPTITRPDPKNDPNAKPKFDFQNLIRTAFWQPDNSPMKAPVPTFVCPGRRDVGMVSDVAVSGTSQTQGICG